MRRGVFLEVFRDAWEAAASRAVLGIPRAVSVEAFERVEFVEASES